MGYIPTIGLEVHTQLNTKTKLFCSCPTSFGDIANKNTCPVCLALPGALPVLNKEVLDKAILAAFVLNMKVHKRSIFDRKNYFYPDLPKGYQISQLYHPYSTGGYLDITLSDKQIKRINITRIHIEEDAGKLIHSGDSQIAESYVDLNRAGTPLIEIVSEPELASANEAVAYLMNLKSILEYIEVSNCNMDEGSFRCDANVSIRKNKQEQLGTRTEIKNLNSFKAIQHAINYEINRQTEVLENNELVEQETRLWDPLKESTFVMRSKGDALDYRYFPDPDLVPLILSEEQLTKLKETLPELGHQKRERYINELMLPEYDAAVLTFEKSVALFFEKLVLLGTSPKKASNWIMVEIMAVQKEKKCLITDICSAEQIHELLEQVEKGNISGKIAKIVFQEIIQTNKKPLDVIKEKGLLQISDVNELDKVLKKVMQENNESVIDYRKGKERAFKHLMGQVMKKTRGQANPALVTERLKSLLDQQ